jgi:hypothetical protein
MGDSKKSLNLDSNLIKPLSLRRFWGAKPAKSEGTIASRGWGFIERYHDPQRIPLLCQRLLPGSLIHSFVRGLVGEWPIRG